MRRVVDWVTERERPLRGRTAQVALIDDVLARVRAGSTVVLLVEGPSGIGKSALLRELGTRARRAGFRAVSARSVEDMQMVPFAPLFEAVLRTDPPICDAARLRALGDDTDSHAPVVGELRTGIVAAASETPLSIALDDVHWADAGTITALHTLVGAGAPVLWTLAMPSTGGRQEVRDAVHELGDVAGVQACRIRLGGLDDGAVAEVAGDVLAADVDDSVLRLAQTARGNPFLLLELLSGLEEEGRLHVDRGRAWAAGATPPARLAATMQRRLDRLSPAARTTVQVASVLPSTFSTPMLVRALARDATEVAAGIAEAVDADLLTEDGDHLAFRHDLLRRAAQHTIPYALRRVMERESAAIMLEMGSAPEEVAAQLARSADVGDVAAVQSLRQAAEALERHNPSGAADLSRRALELLRPDDELHAAVVTKTVTLLNQALRYDEAEELAVVSLKSDTSAEQEAAIRLSRSVVARNSSAQAAEENRRALQLPGISETLRSRHLAWLGYNLAGDGQAVEALVAAVAALTAVDRHDDPVARTIAECALLRVNCAAGRGRECLAPVEQLEPDPGSPLFGLLGAIVAFELVSALATMGHLADATDRLATALADCRGVAAAEQVLELLRAQCELAGGRVDAARDIVESVLSEDDRLLPTLYGGVGFTVMAAVAAHTGDQELSRDVGIAARSCLEGGPAARRMAICALARAAWQRGDDTESARWLEEDVEILTPPLWPADVDGVVLAARVAGASCDAGLRQRVVAAVELLDQDGGADTFYAAVARHARALLDGDADGVDDAAARLARHARPTLRACALEDAGHLRLRSQDRDGAITRLESAFDVYVELGCTADAHRVAKSLNTVGVHRRVPRRRVRDGWGSLTESEIRVLEVVADGATNREAAERLGVSPHTVNAHLRKIFGKLGVHSRAELTALARGT